MKKITGVLVFILAATVTLSAQPILPAINNQPQSAPIDGGLLYLALAGGSYAVMKILGRKKAK